MADQEQVQVELELEPGEAGATVAVAEPVAADAQPTLAEDPIVSLRKQYDELKAKDETRAKALDESRRAEADALAQANRAAREVAEARTQVANTSFQSVEHEITATESEIQVAKREYATAMESGEYGKAADAQEKISAAAAKRVTLERDKSSLDQSRKRQTVVLDQQPQASPYSPEAQAWLRQHPECTSDPEKYYEMVAAHNGALKSRLTPDSREYFDYIDRRMGYAADDNATQSVQSRPTIMPAAPPSRDVAATPGQKVQVSLSASEVKSATDGTLVFNSGPNKGKPIGTQEMARRKALLSREGKYANISLN